MHAVCAFRFNICCGIPSIERVIVNSLELEGFQHDTIAPTLLLIDAPQGFALGQFEKLSCARCSIVVITSNTCPEYLEDLWDLRHY
jgi:hypothetical protein